MVAFVSDVRVWSKSGNGVSVSQMGHLDVQNNYYSVSEHVFVKMISAQTQKKLWKGWFEIDI